MLPARYSKGRLFRISSKVKLRVKVGDIVRVRDRVKLKVRDRVRITFGIADLNVIARIIEVTR